MTHHIDVLKDCQEILTHRQREYGDMQMNFSRISGIASAMLGRKVEPYDIAMIMLAVKISRIANNRKNSDSYVDGINYMAFAAELSQAEVEEVKRPTESKDEF